MIGYFRINTLQAGGHEDDDISYKIRGGRHTGKGDDPVTCEGVCYIPALYYGGDYHIRKEYRHPVYRPTIHGNSNIGKIYGTGKWVGFKIIVYNMPNNNVKIIGYVDPPDALVDGKPANKWQQLFEMEDKGEFQGAVEIPEKYELDEGTIADIAPYDSMAKQSASVTKVCNAQSVNEKFTWGGPVVTYRLDYVTSVDLKFLYVSEIEPL